MKINSDSSISDGGAAVFTAPGKQVSSCDISDENDADLMMILTQSRDDNVEEDRADANKDVAAVAATALMNEGSGVGEMREEIQQTPPDAVPDNVMAPAVLTRSGSAMSHASLKTSNSVQTVCKTKAPVVLYRSRTSISRTPLKKPDKSSSPTSFQKMATPATLSRSRTATPQISSEKSTPTFHDMMKLVALSRAKSIKIKLPMVAEPEETEKLPTVEEENATSVVSPQSCITLAASSETKVDDVEVEPDEYIQYLDDDDTETEDEAEEEFSAAEETDEEFASVEVVEVVELIEEVEVELAEEPDEPIYLQADTEKSVDELDFSSVSYARKPSWAKMKRFFGRF